MSSSGTLVAGSPRTTAVPRAVYAPVRSLVVYLTEDCNLACSYCFVKKSPRRMSSETARQAVEFFLHRNVSGVLRDIEITFFGGEPFLELDRMEEIVALARQRRPNTYKHVTFGVTTNGTIFNERVERIVREAGMKVLVSLDGTADASSQRLFCSGQPSHDVVARNLPRFVACSPHTAVRMTFHPQALDLVGNVRHALELGAPAVGLCRVIEADWNGHEAALEEACERLADWYIGQVRSGVVPPLVVTHLQLMQLHCSHHGGTRPPRSCRMGHSLLSVDPDGNVMACHRCLYRPADWVGRVEQPVLAPTRQKHIAFSSHQIVGCHSCVARPVCGGGCRVAALEAGYDFSQAHPHQCLIMRSTARALLRIYDTLMAEGNETFGRMLESSFLVPPGLTHLLSE